MTISVLEFFYIYMCVIDLSMCNCRTESSTQSFILVIVAVFFFSTINQQWYFYDV